MSVSKTLRFVTITKAMLLILVIFCFKPQVCYGLKQQLKDLKLIKQPRETNSMNFVRLLFFRLIYGIASLMGFDEGLSEVANGAFVPPGVDNDYGFGFDYRDSDDYSYSDNDDDDY